MSETNTRVVLRARPSGAPALSDFATETGPVPEPGPDQVLLRTLYLSLDPYLRGRMAPSASHRSLRAPLELGSVMEGGTVAQVVTSTAPGLRAGDVVVGMGGWQQYFVAAPTQLRRLDPYIAPVSTALGVLGMPGLTAYAGLLEIGRPQPGQTVVVAAATGAVGSLVGQLARIKGARVVGIAGGQRKLDWLEQAGFDAAVDHRSPTFVADLAAATPEGVDVYFENVGGRVWQAVEPRLNRHARVPLCGVASVYSNTERRTGGDIDALMSGLLTRSITIQGFVFTDYEHLRPRFEAEVSGWLRSGQIVYHEDVVHGLDAAPEAFLSLLGGTHLGKVLVHVADPE